MNGWSLIYPIHSEPDGISSLLLSVGTFGVTGIDVFLTKHVNRHTNSS